MRLQTEKLIFRVVAFTSHGLGSNASPIGREKKIGQKTR
jgi:hypothetical protein